MKYNYEYGYSTSSFYEDYMKREEQKKYDYRRHESMDSLIDQMQELEKERDLAKLNERLSENNLPDLETLKKMFHEAYPEYNL